MLPSTPYLLLTPAHVVAAAAAAYVGPGDVVSGASGWWSPARAYSAAFAAGAGPIMDIVDSGGLNPATIHILTTGFCDVATLSAWIGSHGTASVTKLYDQTGNGIHADVATAVSVNPTIALSGLNGLPVLVMAAANGQRLISTNTLTIASQPYSLSAVYNATSGSAAGGILGTTSDSLFVSQWTSADHIYLDATGAFTATATVAASSATWHAIQGVANGASGVINVSGADTTGLNTGTDTITASTVRIGRDSFAEPYDGKWAEGGFWPSGFNATQRGNMYANQNGANGYNGAV